MSPDAARAQPEEHTDGCGSAPTEKRGSDGGVSAGADEDIADTGGSAGSGASAGAVASGTSTAHAASGIPGSRSHDGGKRMRSKAKAKKQRSFWRELPLLIGIALVLALLIKTFFVQAFSIPSNSMQNTLQIGDRVLVDKLTPWFGSKPQRGEVVVFQDPGHWLNESPMAQPTGIAGALQETLSFIGLMPSAEEKDLIKRVIAVGGDTVECKRGGPVKVNGKALHEPYLFPGDTPCDGKAFGPVTVPKGKLWVMGDHRSDSLDSRYHQKLKGGGTVPESQVIGRAIVVAWPVTHWAALPVPDTFSQKGLESKAAAAAPAALGLAGAFPLVLWRRRRRYGRETGEHPITG